MRCGQTYFSSPTDPCRESDIVVTLLASLRSEVLTRGVSTAPKHVDEGEDEVLHPPSCPVLSTLVKSVWAVSEDGWDMV